MIVISIGLQKSGSGLYFNLTNDLLIAAGKRDIHQIKSEYGLENVLNHYNCNIGNLKRDNFKRLLPIHQAGNSFAVKTHNGPTDFVKELMKRNLAMVTCIFRDPRDVVLSALDHGKIIRSEGENHTFASCTSIENTIPMVKSWLDNSIMKWLEMDNILIVKYENLIEKPVEELERLAKFLKIGLVNINLKTIYSKYNTRNLDDFQKDYLHFNKGIASRFRAVLSADELETCNRSLLNYLERLGYPVE